MHKQSFFRGFILPRLNPPVTGLARPRFNSKKARQVFGFCRWLHIYVSCALFGLLLFFCLTGITLNHPGWAGKALTETRSFSLPEQLLSKQDDDYQVKRIQAYIEEKTGLASPRSVDIALDIGELTYDYPLPAGYAFVTVLLEDRLVEIEHARGGLLALFNDLHKGRHSGIAWAWLIDLSAALMILFTLTGIAILLQNAKHRRRAFVALLLGLASPLFIYLLAVPRLIQ